MLKLKKVGMRTIKTGIAVTLCVFASKFLVQNPMYAGVGCIVSVQDTVKGSVKSGLNRIKGTILGGVIGFICVLIKPGDPILSGLGIISTIYGCTTLKLNTGIIVSSVTFLSIHLGVITTNPAYYSIHRIIDTSVGVIIGVLVNYLLVRPDYIEGAYKHLEHIEKLVKSCLEDKIIKKENFSTSKLEKEIQRLELLYSKIIDELNYSKNQKDVKNIEKEISLYKQMYFHMQAVEFLENELYLNHENYEIIKKILNVNSVNWELDEEKSTVFNYHLKKIMKEMEAIESINNSIIK